MVKYERWVGLSLTLLALSACNNQSGAPTAPATSEALSSQAYWQGVWQAPRQIPNIEYYYNPSVASFGFSAAMDHALIQWNGVSSRVVPRKVATYSTSTSPVQVVDAYYPGNSAVFGLTTPYKLQGGQLIEADINEAWVQAKVTFYNKPFEPLKAGNLYENRKRQIAVHEVGHSLKLAHTNEAVANETTLPSIMVGNAYPNNDSTADVPQPFDKGELRQKWGN